MAAVAKSSGRRQNVRNFRRTSCPTTKVTTRSHKQDHRDGGNPAAGPGLNGRAGGTGGGADGFPVDRPGRAPGRGRRRRARRSGPASCSEAGGGDGRGIALSASSSRTGPSWYGRCRGARTTAACMSWTSGGRNPIPSPGRARPAPCCRRAASAPITTMSATPISFCEQYHLCTGIYFYRLLALFLRGQVQGAGGRVRRPHRRGGRAAGRHAVAVRDRGDQPGGVNPARSR